MEVSPPSEAAAPASADRVSEVYAGTHGNPVFQRHLRARVHWTCRQVRGRRVLDVGCSQGIVPLLLAREGFAVTGIDVEATAIARAEAARAEESDTVAARVRFMVGDILSADLTPGGFDTVILGEVLEHLVRPERVIRRCYELLAEGGRLIVTVPFGLHPHADHQTTFRLSNLLAVLGSQCVVEEWELIHTPGAASTPVPILGVVARKAAQAAPPGVDTVQRWLEFSDRAFAATEDRYRAVAEALEQQRTSLREQAATRQREQSALREQMAMLRGRMAELTASARALSTQLTALQRERQRLQSEVSARDKALGQFAYASRDRDRMILQLSRKLAMMEDATSYRVGLLMVRALQRPYKLILLPFQLIALLGGAARRRLRGGKAKPEPGYAPLPRELTRTPELPARVGDAAGVTAARAAAGPGRAPSAASASEAEETVKLLLAGLYEDPRTVQDLKVAAILDEFSLACFGPECRVVTFRPDNWKQILERERPHFLLVESAWKGNGGSWEYRVASYDYPGREELEALVQWCRENRIPTAFWNKEDPVHFARFIETAKLFEVVFTTDANCVAKYREAVGHDRVYALPFAAQPRLHNPIRVPGHRAKSVCFAGSYYANRHEQRREEMEWLLDTAMGFGLEIYDRNHGHGGPGTFTFPERFGPAIRGGVSYQDIVKVYKQYRVFLNVNSVTDSPTMFSRRVFELLACGTPVVSTPAQGLAKLLGEEVVRSVGSRGEAEEAIRTLLVDQAEWERLSLSGQRAVHASHTYAHRLQTVARHLGYDVGLPAPAKVTTVTWTTGEEGAVAKLTETLSGQRLADFEAIVVGPAASRAAVQMRLERHGLTGRSLVLPAADASDGADWWQQALREASGEYIAWLNPEDHYGAWYLSDLVRALSYSGAEVVGKAAHFAIEDGGTVCLLNEEMEYCFVTGVLPAAMVARREIAQALGRPNRAQGLEALQTHAGAGVQVFAVDRFNYLRSGTAGDGRADR